MRITNSDKIIIDILYHPELCLTKTLYVVDTTFIQIQAVALFEKYTNTKRTVNHVTTEGSLKQVATYLTVGNIFQGYAAYHTTTIYNKNCGICFIRTNYKRSCSTK
jgi:hypothetical protein